MKRILMILLVVAMLLISSCSAPNNKESNNSNKETIEINADNFKEYFEIKSVSDYVNVTKHGGVTVLGRYIPVYYSAEVGCTIHIYPIRTMEIENVTVDLHVFDVAHYIDVDENYTVRISASGETITKQFVGSTIKDFFDEHFFDGHHYGVVVENATGTITINKTN